MLIYRNVQLGADVQVLILNLAWKYLVVLCIWGERLEEFPSVFTAPAEM